MSERSIIQSRKKVYKIQYLVWDFSRRYRRQDLKFSFSFLNFQMKHLAVMFWRIPIMIWPMIQLGKAMTEKVQHEPHDPSLFGRDFIIYFYNFISNKTSPLFWIVDFSEIHYQRKNGIQNTKSTVMSYVILAFMLLFILLAFWQWCKAKTEEGLEKLKYFKLLVDDMKPKWICRAYWLIFLLRRTAFLAIIFFTDELAMIGKVILFVVIQTFYLAYIAVLRPNAGFKENLIDFINEVFYFYFVGFMLYYNSEDRWSDTITDVYFWVMMSNNFVLMFVLFCK